MGKNDSPLKGFRQIGEGAKERSQPQASRRSTSSAPSRSRQATPVKQSTNRVECEDCGAFNQPGARFCGECGTSLEHESVASSKSSTTLKQKQAPAASSLDPVALWNKLTRGFKLSSAAASSLVLFFFLPWITVSCGASSFQFTGSELASGYVPGSYQQIEPSPWLYGLFIVAALALFFAYRHVTAEQDKNLATLGLFGLAVIGGAALLLTYQMISSSLNTQVSQYGIQLHISSEIGLIGTVIALLGIAVGGELNRRDL